MDYDHRQPYIPSYQRQDYQGPPSQAPSSSVRIKPLKQKSRGRSQSRYRRYDDADEDSDRQMVERRRRQSLDTRRKSYVYDDSGSDNDRYARSRSRGRGDGGRGGRGMSPGRRSREGDMPSEAYTVIKAAKSSLVAAAVEAVRCRNEPGPWTGQKGKRVATAALSGAAYGALRNGRLRKDGKLPIADAAVTGIYAVDFLKRVLRQTDHEKGAEEERREKGGYDRGYECDYDDREPRRRR